jgi:hypothetical protein
MSGGKYTARRTADGHISEFPPVRVVGFRVRKITAKQDRAWCHSNTGLVTMGRCSVAHTTAAFPSHYEGQSVIRTQPRLRQQLNVTRYGVIPTHNRILLWIRKFEDTDTEGNCPHGAPRTVRTEMFAEQANHFRAVHIAQICNIHAPWA